MGLVFDDPSTAMAPPPAAAPSAAGAPSFKVPVQGDPAQSAINRRIRSVLGLKPAPQKTVDMPTPPDPQQAQVEALKRPLVDPVDLAVFGPLAFTEGATDIALKEGTDILSEQALKAGTKKAIETGAGFYGVEKGQQMVDPLASRLEQRGKLGQLAGGTLRQVGAFTPLVAPALIDPAAALVSGKGDIEQAARKATSGAWEAGTTERAGLETKAAAEAQAEQEAALKGRAKATNAAELELADQKATADKRAVSVAQSATKAQQGMPDVQQAAESKASAAYDKLHDKILKEARTGAREETIQDVLGKPGETTMEQGPQRIARGEEFRAYTSNPLERWRADWKQRRNSLLEPMKDTGVDDSPLRERIQRQTEWSETHKPYDPKVQKILDGVMGTAAAEAPTGPPSLEALKVAMKQQKLELAGFNKLPPTEQAQLLQSMYKQGIIQPLEATAATAQPRTVKELIQLQEQANAMSRSAKGANRTALREVVRGIDDSLTAMDAPTLKKINAEYADHRLQFPYQFEDSMRTAPRPVDAAGEIFNEPQRASDLARLSNPQERAQQAALYRDWIAEKGTGAVTKDHAAFLKYLFPGTPLAKPEAWIYENRAVNSLGEMFETSPVARARFQKSIDQAQGQYRGEVADQIVKAAYEDSDPKKMGPAGFRIRRLIDAAKTPEEKARIAITQFQQLNPPAAGAEAGQIAGANAPTVARQAAAQYQPPPYTTEAREAARTYQPPDPGQAGVKAIQTYKPPEGFAARWKRRAEIWLFMEGGALLSGGTPMRTATFGLAAAPIVLGREAIVSAYRYSLRNPENALRFYNAILDPGVGRNLDYIADQAVRAQVADKLGHPSAPGPVTPPPAEPAPRTPGPMSKAIDRGQAVQMASERGKQDETHIDQIQGLNKQVAMGGSPDIHQDLSSGRLSNTEVRKLVNNEQVASIFGNMSLPDAFDAFNRGTADEKAMALPSLAQKLNDEGRDLPPVQRRAYMAQLHQSLSGGEEAVA